MTGFFEPSVFRAVPQFPDCGELLMNQVFGGRSWSLSGMIKESSKGSWKTASPVSRVKKKSYGNIHSIKDRGIHEISESMPGTPLNSPRLQRRSLMMNTPLSRTSLLAR